MVESFRLEVEFPVSDMHRVFSVEVRLREGQADEGLMKDPDNAFIEELVDDEQRSAVQVARARPLS